MTGGTTSAVSTAFSAMPRLAKKVTVPATVDRIVRRIVRRFDPELVILFGSHARGEAGPDSDVDLFVVMDFDGSAFEQGLEIYQVLHDRRVPLDVIVTRPGDFAWRKDVVGAIEWPAAREGKVLYARPQPRRRRDPRVARQGGQ